MVLVKENYTVLGMLRLEVRLLFLGYTAATPLLWDGRAPFNLVYWSILNVSIHVQGLMLYSLFFTSGAKGSENTTHVCRILLKTSVDDLPTSSPVFEASWTSPPSLLRLLQIQARIR